MIYGCSPAAVKNHPVQIVALLMVMLEHTLQQEAIYLVMMSFLMMILKQISTTNLRMMIIFQY